jgi:diguanylate cyclase (GGDEF)-like protein
MPPRYAYAVAGGLLAAGAPLGLLLVRWARAGSPGPSWIGAELSGDVATYVYVSVSTVLAFALFGFVLGRQVGRLQALSKTDPLTGLPNRRAFFERLAVEFARAARYNEPLSLLLIDVDHLKDLNDTGGHSAGDAALRRVAAAVRNGLRAADLGARLGGDEFVLIAPSTPPDAAAHLAERVRGLVTEGGAAGPPSATTVSIGIATFGTARLVPGPEALLRVADHALYVAKAGGRNRVAAR